MKEKIADLYRQYRTWKIRRRWSRMTPWGQVEAMLTALERDPQLRKRFRRALGFRADGSEREAGRPTAGKS